MLLSMSWQLALSVLLPVIGGYGLDKYLNTKPLFTLLGLGLAFLLVISVMVKVVKEANDKTAKVAKKEDN
jgi:F0F1-type ATP synthase assembly protein I